MNEIKEQAFAVNRRNCLLREGLQQMVCVKELMYAVGSHLYKHKKMEAEALFHEMKGRLDSKEPFVAGKIGGTELWALRTVEFGYHDQAQQAYEQLCNWSGFFSVQNDPMENLSAFAKVMKTSIGSIDYLNRWQYPKDEYFVQKYCRKDVKDIDWFGIVYENRPIGEILAGRKVIVVTPFDDEVRAQYQKRTQVLGEDYLPEFELKTFKAVQTIAGAKDSRFKEWFEALDYMCNRIRTIDFDIALVGCGAYSIPICDAIKQSGRSAIHMGGDIQILFGIMGKRWEEDKLIQSLRNENWIHPYETSIPKNSDSVEDGCYW